MKRKKIKTENSQLRLIKLKLPKKVQIPMPRVQNLMKISLRAWNPTFIKMVKF